MTGAHLFCSALPPSYFCCGGLNFTTKALRHKADEVIETQNVASLRVAVVYQGNHNGLPLHLRFKPPGQQKSGGFRF